MKRKSKRKRQNLARFNKKSVDVAKFVKDLYVDRGMAYISCNVKNYYDIISPYSVDGYEWPNPEFIDFVDGNADCVPTEYPIVLEICGCKFNQQQRECIEETVADYYALQLGHAQLELQHNRWECWVLFVFGIVSILGIWLATRSHVGNTVWEILLVLLCFFIWEFLETFAFERNEFVQKKLEAAQMASMKLTFQEKFEDGPVEPEEQKQILEEIFDDEVIVPSVEWE